MTREPGGKYPALFSGKLPRQLSGLAVKTFVEFNSLINTGSVDSKFSLSCALTITTALTDEKILNKTIKYFPHKSLKSG